MTRTDFTSHLKNLQSIESTINDTKGPAYAGSEDALSNFKRLGEIFDISPLKVCLIYMTKHIDSLNSFAKGNRTDPEPIEMRIVDIRLYAALALALIKDGEKQYEP